MKSLIIIGFTILTILNPLGATYATSKTSNQAQTINPNERVSIYIPDLRKVTVTVSVPQQAVPKPAAKLVSAPVAAPVTPPAVTPQTSVPTEPPAAPVYSTDCSAYLGLVEQYDWPVDTMMAIMQAESSCNPDAYNPSGCYGLFQLMGEDITDPAANIAAAYQKYLDQGLNAWSTYTSGAYLKFL